MIHYYVANCVFSTGMNLSVTLGMKNIVGYGCLYLL